MSWDQSHPPRQGYRVSPESLAAQHATHHSLLLHKQEGGRVFEGGSCWRSGLKGQERQVESLARRAGNVS